MLEQITGVIVGVVLGTLVAHLYGTYVLPRTLKKNIVTWIQEEENQKAIESYFNLAVEKIKMSILGTVAGISSGLSREMKAVEGELVQDGISNVMGNPMLGALVAKYSKKYPMLGQVLIAAMQNPQLIQGLTKSINKPQAQEELGKV